MSIQWETGELRKLTADLGDAQGRVGKKVAAATRKAGQKLLREVKQRSPVRTGELKGSWGLNSFGDGRSGGMSVAVRSTVRQAFFQEYGTSKMAAQPSANPALEAVAPGYMAEVEKAASEFLDS